MKHHHVGLLRAVLASALLLLVLFAPASAQGPLFTFRSSGEFASVSTFEGTPTGFRQLFVSVSRGGTVSDPRTFLSFSTSELADGVLTRQFGFGSIPNESLTTDSQGRHLALQVDVNAVPGFQKFQSITVSGCTTTTPTVPSDGLISLSWDQTPDRWSRSEGHSMTQLGDFVLHSQGSFASFSATVQGSALGQGISGQFVFPTIGTNRNVFMQVQRGQ
jgi:hypothetical protein